MKDYLTDEQIEEFGRFASLLFDPGKIGLMLGLSVPDLQRFEKACQTQFSEEYIIYQKNRLLTEAEIRTSIISNAKNGSKDAQNTALDFLNDENWKDA